jgi:signal transduction histidine kinase
MRILLLFMAFCFVTVTKAQNEETDSLKKLLNTTKESSERVVILEGLSYAYLSAYPDTALQYAIQGLQLAQEINDRQGEYLCTEALANVYFHVGDYTKALELYLQCLKIKEKINRKGMAVTFYNIADVYTEEADYPHALYYLFKAKQADEKSKDSTGILYDLYSLGAIYQRMQKNDSALFFTKQAYELAQDLQDKNLIGAILNIYGEIYVSLKDATLASRYYNLSIPYADAIKDHEVLASDYFGLAKVFKQRGMPDSSIHYASKALRLAQDAPFLKQVVEISEFLVDLFKTKKQLDSAFIYQQLNISTKDSLYNIENVKKIQNLKFMEQQRQQAIATARNEYRAKVKFYIVIFALCGFLIITGMLWRNNRQKQASYLMLQEQKRKTEKAYEELKSTQSQLIQSEKMASLGELTAGIAHEIQNPLNFVNNFSEVNSELIEEMKIEIDKKNIDEVRQIADNIKENQQKINHHGKRADAIVKGMLQHSRSSTEQKEPTDINSLAEEYLRLSYHGLRAKNKSFNAKFETNLAPTVGKVNVVPQDIGRVFLNLFTNAFYAVTEKNASLHSSNQAESEEQQYEPTVLVSTRRIISSSENEDMVEIRVKDNGVGIPPKVLDKIFQPFFTTKPTGQGTGLGLSLSYDIIKAHGGEIKVNTKEGEGTEFVIHLPSI